MYNIINVGIGLSKIMAYLTPLDKSPDLSKGVKYLRGYTNILALNMQNSYGHIIITPRKKILDTPLV